MQTQPKEISVNAQQRVYKRFILMPNTCPLNTVGESFDKGFKVVLKADSVVSNIDIRNNGVCYNFDINLNDLLNITSGYIDTSLNLPSTEEADKNKIETIILYIRLYMKLMYYIGRATGMFNEKIMANPINARDALVNMFDMYASKVEPETLFEIVPDKTTVNNIFQKYLDTTEGYKTKKHYTDYNQSLMKSATNFTILFDIYQKIKDNGIYKEYQKQELAKNKDISPNVMFLQFVLNNYFNAQKFTINVIKLLILNDVKIITQTSNGAPISIRDLDIVKKTFGIYLSQLQNRQPQQGGTAIYVRIKDTGRKYKVHIVGRKKCIKMRNELIPLSSMRGKYTFIDRH